MKIVLFLIQLVVGLFNAAMKLLLYRWFIVPLGAPDLMFWHACGVTLLLGLWQWPGYADIVAAEQHPANEVRQAGILLFSTLTHLVAVGFGWLLLFFAGPF